MEAALKAQESQMKQHQAYLQNLYDKKPEHAQSLAGCLKYLDEQLSNMKATMADPVHRQKIIDETKQIVQGMAVELKKEYDGKIG